MCSWREILGIVLLASLSWTALALAQDVMQQTSSRQPASEVNATAYWQRRQVVSFIALIDSLGSTRDAILSGNRATAPAADSLAAVVKSWKLPLEMGRDWGTNGIGCGFALDRAERAARDPGQRLPATVRTALTRGVLACWTRVLEKLDPDFSLDDFVAHGADDLRIIRSRGLLKTPEMRARSQFGLLHPSPGGRYVLDPFAGTELYPSGQLGRDVDTGYAIFDAKTGDRLCYCVGTIEAIDFVRWTSHTTFVMAGIRRMEDPNPGRIRASFWVPVVWRGDFDRRTITEFLGAPIPPLILWDLRDALHTCRQSAYPKVLW